MAEKEGDGDQGFKVQDRRRFSETGELRPEAANETDAPPAETPADPPRDATTAPASEPASEQERHAETPITFATFILSLSTQALAHLGEIPQPADGATRVELEAAQEIIDILAMLQEKARGNLTPEEDAQLEGALYVLRMKYVECQHRR